MNTLFPNISNPNNNNFEKINKINYSKCPNYYIEEMKGFCPGFAPKTFEKECAKSQNINNNSNASANSEIKCFNYNNNCTWKGQTSDLLSHLLTGCKNMINNPQENTKKNKNFKKTKWLKCLFSNGGCSKYILKSAYHSHLIEEHYEEIFCSVKKFDVLNDEKNNSEKKYKKLLRGVIWADFYQKKAIEKLQKENQLLKRKIKEINEVSNQKTKFEQKKFSFKPFLSKNSETKAGFFVMQNEEEDDKDK